MRLTHKIVVAHAVVLMLLALGLGINNRVLVGHQTSLSVRDRLLAEARLVQDLLAGAPGWLEDTDKLQQHMLRTGMRIGDRVTIIAPDGTVLADSQSNPRDMDNHNTRPEVQVAREQRWGWRRRYSYTLGQDMVYVAVADRPDGLVVRLAAPLAKVTQLSRGLETSLMWAVVLGVLLALVASFWLARGLTSSLGHLSEVARRLGAGDLEARAQAPANDEVGSLAATMNQMAESLRHASEELAETTAQARAILHHMRDGLLVVDEDERLVSLNPAASRLLGVRFEQVEGKPIEYVVASYDLAEAVRRARQAGAVSDVEFELREVGGRILQAYAAPIELGGAKRGVCVVLRDVTQMRALERVRQDFVANASHELRTPVTAIRSLAENLLAGAARDPEAGPQFLEEIVENTERLEALVRDMLDLARLDAEVDRLDAIAVGPVVAHAAERVLPQAEASGVVVQVRAPAGIRAHATEENVETAVVNLLDNAIKYAAEGGTVEVEVTADGDEVQVAVVDHGPGIPPADQVRVFERFYRVDKARSRELGGTGLGLSIVKHAVEAMGGRVSVATTPGGGATFVVHLRAARAD